MKNQAYNEFNDQPERFIPVNVDNRCYSNIVGARLTERGTRSVEAAGGEVTFLRSDLRCGREGFADMPTCRQYYNPVDHKTRTG